MNYEVELTRAAEKYLDRLDLRMQQRIAEVLGRMSSDPFGAGSKPLVFPRGRRSWRVGGLRMLYSVDRTAKRVTVMIIGPRGEVYRNLDR